MKYIVFYCNFTNQLYTVLKDKMDQNNFFVFDGSVTCMMRLEQIVFNMRYVGEL